MTIHIIGIGLDGLVGLGESVRQVLDGANLVVGSDRHLSYLSNFASEKPEDSSIPKLSLKDITKGLSELGEWIINWQRDHHSSPHVVILVSGDPLFFGLGRLLIAEFPSEKLIFYPHISSMQLAFNRLQIPWQDATLISVHGRSMDSLTSALKQGVEKIAVLTDGNNTPQAIAQLILSLDLPITYEFWVCENLGGEDEKVKEYSLNSINSCDFSQLNVVILLRHLQQPSQCLDLSDIPLLGIPDRLFFSYSDRPGLMTKKEVRVLALGELSLQPNQVIWDIGSGTGSVSVEISRLFPSSTIYAIEKTAAGTSLIEQNCHQFQVNNIISIHGEAPTILHHLRTPDRIFIGGSGGNLPDILGTCSIRLSPRGRIVLALATLEHLNLALDWVKHRIKLEKSWTYQLLQIQISRSVAIADLTRFSPLNPVTILTIYHHSLFT